MQRVYAPQIADQALGYLLAFTPTFPTSSANSQRQWSGRRPESVLDELDGKTLQVIGLGGIGTEIARRAYGFGMRVIATDPKVWSPSFVDELHKPDKFHDLLPRADVVASAVPLSKSSLKMIGAKEFGLMKPGVVLINVSRGRVVDTDAFVAALDSKQVSAAGLDVTDPEPFPEAIRSGRERDHHHPHRRSVPGGVRRCHEVFRENLRRFAAGEALFNIVDKKVGY